MKQSLIVLKTTHKITESKDSKKVLSVEVDNCLSKSKTEIDNVLQLIEKTRRSTAEIGIVKSQLSAALLDFDDFWPFNIQCQQNRQVLLTVYDC